MCEAFVYWRPSATKKNSPAKPKPTLRASVNFTFMFHFSLSQKRLAHQSRKAAPPERRATCIRGPMAGALALMAVC